MSEIKAYGFCENDCRREVYTKEQTVALLQAAIDNGSLASCTGNVIISEVQEINKNVGLKFWLGTQAEYNAIENYSADVHYIITDDTTLESLNNAVAALQADESVTTTKLATGSVTTEKLANGAVTAEKIAAGAIPPGVSYSKIVLDTVTFTDGNGKSIKVTPTLYRYATEDSDGGLVVIYFDVGSVPSGFDKSTVTNDEFELFGSANSIYRPIKDLEVRYYFEDYKTETEKIILSFIIGTDGNIRLSAAKNTYGTKTGIGIWETYQSK